MSDLIPEIELRLLMTAWKRASRTCNWRTKDSLKKQYIKRECTYSTRDGSRVPHIACQRKYGSLNCAHHLLYAILRGKHFTHCFNKRTNVFKMGASGLFAYEGFSRAMWILKSKYELSKTIIRFNGIEFYETVNEQAQLHMGGKAIPNKIAEGMMGNYARAINEINEFSEPLSFMLKPMHIIRGYEECRRQIEEAGIKLTDCHGDFHQPPEMGY